MTKVAHNIYRQLSSQCVWTTGYRTTSVYRYMKLSVIVIPRISPSTAAAAAAQCQQVVPYKKPPFSSNEATASSFILPKKFLQSLLPSPQKQYLFSSFSSSILILSHLPIYFCVPVPVPVPIPYLTQATSPHLTLTSSSPTPQKETTPPNASSKPFVSQGPIFPFRLDCSC